MLSEAGLRVGKGLLRAKHVLDDASVVVFTGLAVGFLLGLQLGAGQEERRVLSWGWLTWGGRGRTLSCLPGVRACLALADVSHRDPRSESSTETSQVSRRGRQRGVGWAWHVGSAVSTVTTCATASVRLLALARAIVTAAALVGLTAVALLVVRAHVSVSVRAKALVSGAG